MIMSLFLDLVPDIFNLIVIHSVQSNISHLLWYRTLFGKESIARHEATSSARFTRLQVQPAKSIHSVAESIAFPQSVDTSVDTHMDT